MGHWSLVRLLDESSKGGPEDGTAFA